MKTGKRKNHPGLAICTWRPLYGVNPSLYGDALSLNVDSESNLIDFSLALSVAGMYGVTANRASEEVQNIKGTVESNWQKLAKKYEISRREIEEMSPAFDMRFKG